MNDKIFSVIIPTYDSEKTLPLALKSIVNQTLERKKIEILVIDGGSKDKTREIALKYDAIVLDNPKIQPEHAKSIGMLNANGKYLVFMDSDEVLNNKSSFELRVEVFKSYPDLKLILFGGYHLFKDRFSIKNYINICGDPLNHFMFNPSTRYGEYIKILKKRLYTTVETDDYIIFDISKNYYLPLVDLGSTICFEKSALFELKKNNEKILNAIPQIFNYISGKYNLVCFMKKDEIYHHSSETITKYMNKLKWRVIRNVHYSNEPDTGFKNREKFHTPLFGIKKYFFIPYSFSIVLPILESIYLSLKYKNLIFLIHWLLTLFCSVEILYQYTLKFFGIQSKIPVYGRKN